MTNTTAHHKLTLKSAIDALSSKKISLTELYSDLETATNQLDSEWHVYLKRNPEAQVTALKQENTLLWGAPIAVKDNFCTKDLETTAASTVLDGFKPPFSATAITKLEQAGGVVYGKANMDAWAHGSTTETSQYGRTLNPRNTNHLPGGSSGGSAAAVAGDLCLGALGSETGGSIRQPAAWCGVVGLKPTYGRVSRQGVVAMGSSLDCPGTLTKTVEDAALLLTAIAGKDPYDATTSSVAVPDYTKQLTDPLQGLRVGVLYSDLPGLETLKPHLEQAMQVFKTLGCSVEYAQALDPHYAIAVYTVVQRGEVSSNLARYDGVRYGNDRSFFGSEAKRRSMLGAFTLSKGYADQYYLTAQKVRTLFIEDYKRLFAQYDILINMTNPGFAKKVGATEVEGSALFGELEDMLLEPSCLAGIPGISVPCFRDQATNLFLGLNITAPHWQEALVLRAAHAYETATEWNTWRSH